MSDPVTTLEQLCTAATDSTGAVIFSIHSTLTVLKDGDLPFTNIFVMQIPVANDPKSDVFQRIATVVDLTVLSHGRDDALGKNQTAYLATFFDVSYSDVATATTAKQLIQARVDRLISDWKTYNTVFITPEFTPLPLTSPDVLTQLVNTYVAAKAAAATADSNLAVATNNLSVANDAVAPAIAAVTAAQAASLECATNLGNLGTGSNACTNLVTAANAAVNGTGGVDGSGMNPFKALVQAYATAHPGTSLDAALVTFGGVITTFQLAITTGTRDGQSMLTTLVGAIGPQCTAKQNAITTASNTKTTADTTAALAQTALAAAQAQDTAAQAAEAAALAAVLAVCPTYVP